MPVAPEFEDVHRRLQALARADRFSGAMLAVREGVPVLAEAYGLASRAWQMPCALDTRFDSASITKLFTAVATLQLVERRAFSLDTSVVDHLGLSGSSISTEVTPYHLLTHTSGIADDADEEAGERYEDLFRSDPTYAFTDIAANLPHFINKPPNFPPGEGCRYCNAGYLLLGLMVERATGTSYRTYVERNVLEPAGMTRSGFLRMDVVEPDVAEAVEPIVDSAERIVGWRRNIYAYPPIGDSAGGAHVTVGDLIAFHRSLCAGRLLGPDLTAAMLTPQELHSTSPDGSRRMMGFGFEFRVAADGRVRHHQKDGVNVGTSGLLRHYPRGDLTIATLGVGEAAVDEAVMAVDAAIGDG